MNGIIDNHPILAEVAAAKEVFWINPHYNQSSNPTERETSTSKRGLNNIETSQNVNGLTPEMVNDAALRLQRFAPLIMHYFPETVATGGIIESPLTETAAMKEELNECSFLPQPGAIEGRLLLKQDSHLAVSGSVKARGGIYEVLKHTEDLALEAGILTIEDIEEANGKIAAGYCLNHDSELTSPYLKLTSPQAREFFAKHKIQVGSTGNLGLSIGIMSAAIGYEAIVHMSADAKQWKKDLLRKRGATVQEYEGDYGEAVLNGRRLSDADPSSYFVDDENSKELFCGYAVAGGRLKAQLDEQKITVDQEHPLFVYIPCGVGGAPGGIIYGLKLIFGESVHCFLVEPTQAPCMLAGLESGLFNKISVQDLGLTGKTQADGLAVGRASSFVGKVIDPLLSGEATIEDEKLNRYLHMLWKSEHIFIEPSACAAYQGIVALHSSQMGRSYIEALGLDERMPQATHIIWATGGNMVPEMIRAELISK